MSCRISIFDASCAIDEAHALDDAESADLSTEVSRGMDKWPRIVATHSQATKQWAGV